MACQTSPSRSCVVSSLVLAWALFCAMTMVKTLILNWRDHLPYYAVEQAWGFSRSLAECIFLSADLALSYVKPFPFMNDRYLNALQFATCLTLRRYAAGVVQASLRLSASAGAGSR